MGSAWFGCDPTGVPNTVDGLRFSEDDIASFNASWAELLAARTPAPASVTVAPAPVLGREEQNLLDEVGQRLQGEHPESPWWARLVVQHREEFLGAALANGWDFEDTPYPPEIWVPVLLVQQPAGLHLLRGSLRKPEYPKVEEFGPGSHLDDSLLWARYDCEMSFCDAADTNLNPEGSLFVLPDLVHLPGGVATFALPVAFEDFAPPTPARVPRARGSGGTRGPRALPSGVLERLREEFPWLTDEDVRAAADRVPRAETNDEAPARSEQRLSPEDLEDQAYAQVMDLLEEKREQWAWDDEVVNENFYTQVSGGAWTNRFKQTPADSVRALGRAHTKFWCTRFGWSRTKVFHFSAHGELACNVLAREWCRKADFFFRRWCDSVGSETFADRAAHAYCESEEFLDWAVQVSIESPTWAKISELRAAFPRRV